MWKQKGVCLGEACQGCRHGIKLQLETQHWKQANTIAQAEQAPMGQSYIKYPQKIHSIPITQSPSSSQQIAQHPKTPVQQIEQSRT